MRRALECCTDQDYCNRNLQPTLPPLVSSGKVTRTQVHHGLGLFTHPLMKRTAAPQGLLEFPASGTGCQISVHLLLRNTHMNVHAVGVSHQSTSHLGWYRQRSVDSAVDARIGPAGVEVVASLQPKPPSSSVPKLKGKKNQNITRVLLL